MTIRTDRLTESIRTIAIAEILTFSRDYEHDF